MRTQTMPAEGKSLRLNIKKILAPLDFSPASNNAFQYALRFAQEFGAELTLLHVVKPAASPTFASIPGAPAFCEPELATSEEDLRSLATEARAAGVVDAKWTFRVGLAAYEIVKAATELNADLIVIATHGYTGWKHFCIGSTAESVVRTAPCPVFVVREKEYEFT